MAITLMNLTCQVCGYRMDTQEYLEDPSAVPREGDLAVCLNCAAYYELRAGQWQPLSEEELGTLSLETRAELGRIRLGIRHVITEDLAFNQAMKRQNVQ